MFLGLRTAGGIGEEAFRQRFGKTVRDVYRRIPDRHIAEGLLTEKDGRLFLTDRGIDVSNSVMADYIRTPDYVFRQQPKPGLYFLKEAYTRE